MKILRNGGSNYSAILGSCSSANPSPVKTACFPARRPSGCPRAQGCACSSAPRLPSRRCQLYIYKDEDLTPVSGLLTADTSGWVTVENYGGGDLVFVRTDVGSYTVAVITGENGSVEPGGERLRGSRRIAGIQGHGEPRAMSSIPSRSTACRWTSSAARLRTDLHAERAVQPHGRIHLYRGRSNRRRRLEYGSDHLDCSHRAGAGRRRRAVLPQMAAVAVLMR